MVLLIVANGLYREIKENAKPELLAHRIKVCLERETEFLGLAFVVLPLATIPVPLSLFPCSIPVQTARTSHPRQAGLPCQDLLTRVRGTQEAEGKQLRDQL